MSAVVPQKEALSLSTCKSEPHQAINRLFVSAPLTCRVAEEVIKLGEKENHSDKSMSDCHLTDEAEAVKEECEVSDALTGFIITDGT